MNWFLYLGGAVWFWVIGLKMCGIKFELKEDILKFTWFKASVLLSYPIAGLSGISVWIWVCWRISIWLQ